MKYTLLFFLILSTRLHAQKVDILLIGVSHNYSQYPEQDFSGIHAKIKTFNPSAFFGEFVSKEEERLLMDYWCKSDNANRLQILRTNRTIAEEDIPTTINSLRRQTLANPTDYQLKADLAHAYYLNQDVANGHYQFWQVFNHLQRVPNAGLEQYVNKLLSPQLDTTGRSMKRLKTSEYAYIAFPMMQVLQIQELLPMDCQDYDLNWSAASLAFHTKFQKLLNDSSAAESSALKDGLTKREQGFAKNAVIEKTSNKITEWLNTDEAAAMMASGDFYFPEMYDIKDFPKEEMLAQLHWWLMRNKAMCENVVNRAIDSGHKKVVVIAGANHRKFMQDILVKMPGVSVKNINEIE